MAKQTCVVAQLNANWVWIPDWSDSSEANTAGRVVSFTRKVVISSPCDNAVLHISADTRYKIFVNDVRIGVGPARSSTAIWYYDSIDLSKALRQGENDVEIHVLRYFACSRAAMPFERTPFPGLTTCGTIHTSSESIDLSSLHIDWRAQLNSALRFPTAIADDVFLHISERISPSSANSPVSLKPYGFRTFNGDLLPWRLQARCIPLPNESRVSFAAVHNCQSPLEDGRWLEWLQCRSKITLDAGSCHTVDLQADVHSTAFLRLQMRADQASEVSLKITYSEGYELAPRDYPFFRTKADRSNAVDGYLLGPFDEVKLELSPNAIHSYEPFWFRTFRLIRLEINIGPKPVTFECLEASQVNYPLLQKAEWINHDDDDNKSIWDVSVRTLRNCMFDGYSDCPFYEQLQYCCDSRSVALFHYLLSGDDRLMRQAITNFAASITHEGLPQSRFPSYVRQLIAGFSLFWVLAVRDHHYYFGDNRYTRKFLPHIDQIFNFFEDHIDERGLVANLPNDVWQYVDWVTTWGATASHPDKGVPTSGRDINLHTFFSLLYAYVLQQASTLLANFGRAGMAEEYLSRSNELIQAVQKWCFDGMYFTDSLQSIAASDAYSQHCQVFAVLCGAISQQKSSAVLRSAFADPKFSRCSYMMKFYALRAFSMAGDGLYESLWPDILAPYQKMLKNNLTTWEEDDVRQRSDCHAWGSVPIYEFCTEIAGVKIDGIGWSRVLFEPRLDLCRKGFRARVAMGWDNTASVQCDVGKSGEKLIELRFDKSVVVASRLPGRDLVEHGCVSYLALTYSS